MTLTSDLWRGLPPQLFQCEKCEEHHCCNTQQKKKTCLGLHVQALISDSAADLQPSRYRADGRSAVTQQTLQGCKHLRLLMSEAPAEADTNTQRTSRGWIFNPFSMSEINVDMKQPPWNYLSASEVETQTENLVHNEWETHFLEKSFIWVG